MKHLILISMLVSLFFVNGCGEATIDASSEAAMKDSIVKMSADLSDKKKQKFLFSILALSRGSVDMVDVFGSKFNKVETDSRIREKIDGKTVDQIIAEVDAMVEARDKRLRQNAPN